MGRAEDIRARHKAELAVLEAEERLIAAKADKKTSAEKLRAIKDEVRSLRQSYREGQDGAAAASPATAKASASVKKGR